LDLTPMDATRFDFSALIAAELAGAALADDVIRDSSRDATVALAGLARALVIGA
jgi:hypothetical protein